MNVKLDPSSHKNVQLDPSFAQCIIGVVGCYIIGQHNVGGGLCIMWRASVHHMEVVHA